MIKCSLKLTGITAIILFSLTLILSPSYSDVITTTVDPTLVGIGARPVGIGKAFVGLSDDVNAVFINPAGLAGQKTWQVQSMTTQLLNVIRYVSFAGTYNTDFGTFGLGYVGAALGGAVETTISGGIIIPTGDTIDYTSSVILLSYGSEAKRFLSYDWLDKVSVGATLKLFNQSLSGVEGGLMTGYNMDMGMLYKPIPWLSVGWTLLDALPASMGKLTGSSGSEYLPTTTKLGTAVKILGGDDSLYQFDQSLVYLLDLDYTPGTANYPALIHSGFEWWPISYLAIRFGVDQDVIGTGSLTSTGYNVETNTCAGVGIRYGGFSIDYAYHKYGTVSENDTSYVSLSYSPPFEIATAAPAPTPPKEKNYLKISSPADQLITYDDGTVITGKILNVQNVSKLTIEGAKVDFAQDGSFKGTYPLFVGKNAFEIKALDSNDQVLESTKIRILRLTKFSDVPANLRSKEPIEMLAALGFLGGYPDGTFKPDKTINRAELITVLVRTKNPGTPKPVDTEFSDVTKKHWASFFIKTGVDSGLAKGYPDKTFKPAKAVSRAEGVAIYARFADLKMPETLVTGPYTDVPGRHWAAQSIAAARSAGMLPFVTEETFMPNKGLTRGEVAEILANTPFGIQKIKDLKDFDTY